MSPPDRPKHLIALATVLGVLTPGAVAHAVPPSASDFTIIYYTTDEDGDRGRQLTQLDLSQFVNQARCECGQAIEAKITLMTGGMAFDQQRVRTFAGSNCGVAQTPNQQSRPCPLIEDQLPVFYTKGPTVQFEPIWLSTGYSGAGGNTIEDAVPGGTCDSGQGEGGIWICVENGMQTDCQADEFIIQGTQNANTGGTAGTPGAGMMSGGIAFDFDGPLNVPTAFEVSSGDGALALSWEAVTTDIAGYRILCADANGDPLPNKGLDAPSITDQNRGQLYYTMGNLCPEGPFGQGGGEGETGTGGTDDGGTDDRGTDGGGSGTGGTGGIGTTSIGLWDSPLLATTGTTGTAGTAGTGTGTGTGGSTGTGTGTATGSGTGTGAEPGSGEGILSLDWAYVCSPHLAGNADSARVDGLENGQEYQLLVVAYDLAGNPSIASDIIVGEPVETSDFWEQCEEQGNICGKGGFCNCRADSERPSALWLSLFVLVARRRRRRG